MLYSKDNPRFVWTVGAYHEQFPDMPQYHPAMGLVLYDRQEKRAVVTLHCDYAQLMCLETTPPRTGNAPFTALEEWLNKLGSRALESEGIAATKGGAS